MQKEMKENKNIGLSVCLLSPKKRKFSLFNKLIYVDCNLINNFFFNYIEIMIKKNNNKIFIYIVCRLISN